MGLYKRKINKQFSPKNYDIDYLFTPNNRKI